MVYELKYDELKRFDIKDRINKILLDNASTESHGLIAQTRVKKTLEYGLKNKEKGCNIFLTGEPDTGRSTFACAYAKKQAQGEDKAQDLCYVYNFEEPKSPTLLCFSAGLGHEFKNDIDDMINSLSVNIPVIFESTDFENDKNDIVKFYQTKRDVILKEITEEAKTQNFGVKMTNSGLYFMPVVEGEMITEEQFDKLSEDEKEKITKNSDSISQKAQLVMNFIREFDKDTKQDIENIEFNIGLLAVGRFITPLIIKYHHMDKVVKYLTDMREDILDNLEDFLDKENDDDEAIQNIIPWAVKHTKDDSLSKYKVNLLVDRKNDVGAPVVIDYNPTYPNLIGEIEFESEYGNYSADYMKIKAGLFHKANGGYLILKAQDIFSSHNSWETIKRVLTTSEITIEPSKEFSTGFAISAIKPETTPIDVKIIMIGTSYHYEMLSEFDDDFKKLFKINAQFDYEIKFNDENLVSVINYINAYETKNDISFDVSAKTLLVEFMMREAENKNKLSSKIGRLNDIMSEVKLLASSKVINAEAVEKAFDERNFRFDLYEEKLSEMIDDNVIMIDTDGSVIGQINGLAVLDYGEYAFAKPSRITATTYMGKAGIVNIEKEAEMSGAIHNKGVQVIIGYLGQTYAQEFPLSLSCRICFEQNYNGIDGDSASSTELYSIISSLSEVPINQQIAVTGSINQKGEIQPIGGVTYKIEGFFDVCKKRGLTGNQGVIIPIQNVSDLVVNKEVINAVKEGLFHIYPIRYLNQGIEILMGSPAGEKNDKGKFPPESIHGKVFKKLKDFYRKSIDKA